MTAEAETVAADEVAADCGSGGRRAESVARQSDWAFALAVGLTCSLVAWARMTSIAKRTIWAEDGHVFLTDAFSAGPFTNLFRPYGGYLHLVPRSTAELTAAVVPLAWYALALSAAACIIAGGVAALVYVCAVAVTQSRVLRICLAAVTVAVPALPLEVLGNLANIHWFFLWLTPWLLFYRPRSRVGSLVLGLVGLVAALTEIQMVLFAPLVAWRWRERRGWPIRIGMLAGLAGQCIAMLTSIRPPRTGPFPSIADHVAGYTVNAVMTIWLGSRASISAAVATYGWSIAALCLMPSLAALIVVWIRGDATQRLAALVLPAASVVVWSAALVVNRTGNKYWWPAPKNGGQLAILRYAVVPSMFVLAALLLALATFDWSQRRFAWVVFAAALPIGLVAVFNAVPTGERRAIGPVWSVEVERARAACLADRSKEAELLNIAPAGWITEVPCQVLKGM
jgi:hypothetical protein